MAACRRNIPLRDTARIRVDDGTECLMPSPIPGPLREEFAIDPVSPNGSFHRGLSLFRIASETTNPSLLTLAKGKAA